MMTHCSISLHCYGQCEVDGASEAALCQGQQDGDKVLVQAGRAKAGIGDSYYVISYAYALPCEYVRNTKDDHTGDDVQEITEGKDSHQVAEIVPLGSEPDYEAYVANYAQNTSRTKVVKSRGNK